MKLNIKSHQSILFLFLIACVFILFLSETFAKNTDNGLPQLLITIKNEGQVEASVFKSFSRGYADRKKYGSALSAQRQTKSILKDYSLIERKSWQINT